MTGRLVAVCGYSSRGGNGLHEICARRLRLAEREALEDDVVLLSGWARRRSAASEAEHMAESWSGRSRRIVLDGAARSTVGNVGAAARLARELGATKVVLVTSKWHARRARMLLRAALRGTGSTVVLAASDDRPGLRTRLREVVGWALLPAGLLAVRRYTWSRPT